MVNVVENQNKIDALNQLKEKEGTTVIRFIGDQGLFPLTNTVIEFSSPYQIIAEGLYMLAGRSDWKWINRYNRYVYKDHEQQFKHFSLGERIRFWNKSNEKQFVFNPQDQLVNAYEQIVGSDALEGFDRRDDFPIMQLYNPQFDNEFSYNVLMELEDYSPVTITYAWKQEKLSMYVHFRQTSVVSLTNDYLFLFSLLHQMLANWLIKTKELGLKKEDQIVGDLVIYIDDLIQGNTVLSDLQIADPEISFSIEETLSMIDAYFGSLDNIFKDVNPLSTKKAMNVIINSVKTIKDDFFHDTILTLCSSRLLDVYLNTLAQEDLHNVFKILRLFRSEWNIPIYAYLLTDKRLIIPEHLQKEMEGIGDLKEKVSKFAGDLVETP